MTIPVCKSISFLVWRISEKTEKISSQHHNPSRKLKNIKSKSQSSEETEKISRRNHNPPRKLKKSQDEITIKLEKVSFPEKTKVFMYCFLILNILRSYVWNTLKDLLEITGLSISNGVSHTGLESKGYFSIVPVFLTHPLSSDGNLQFLTCSNCTPPPSTLETTIKNYPNSSSCVPLWNGLQ